MSITEELAPPTANQLGLDGLCVIGKLTLLEQVATRDGEPIKGLYNAAFTSSRGTTRVQVSDVSRQPTGDVRLPAFNKFMNAPEGATWIVSLGIIPPRGQSTFTNFLAIDAAEL